MAEKAENTVKNSALKHLKPWKKGECGNPNGRPKGRKNFETLFYEALNKLAEKNGVTPESIEYEIVQKGIMSARKGDYRFYKDLLDRLHGQATQRKEITGKDGKDLFDIEEKKKIDELISSELK